MDYTKNKTFIAFVNKDGKNRWWVDGNMPFDDTSPKVYPYDTKEEKENAKLVGYRIAIWSETGDVEGVILRVQETVPIITKKEALLLEDKLFPKPIREEVQKKEKKKVEEVVEPVVIVSEKVKKVVEKPLEKVLEKPLVVVEEKRGRGRPRKLFDE